MKLSMSRWIFAIISAMSTLLVGCSEHTVDGLDPVAEELADYSAPDPRPENSDDELRQQLASIFLVEQFSVSANTTMLKAIREHQPGGIVFWNGGNTSYENVREVIARYAQEASDARHANLLFSTDYEGGDLKMTVRGSNVVGIQRFRDGFTALAHPAWLGKGTTAQQERLCYLHGSIIAKEMASVGLNYPLSVVSDLAKRLFLNRGISADPQVSARCLKQIMDAFYDQKNVIFVTKHFPGLASTIGDTHDRVAKSDATPEQIQDHLLPFQSTIDHVNTVNSWPLYSIMSGHGFYPHLDPDNITTESSAIVTELLRNRMGFQGLAVSDAMWMGNYGSLGQNQLMAVYLNSFLAGADLLMIPGSRFSQAMNFFRDLYDNQVSDAQKSAVLKRVGSDWETVRARFLERLVESIDRLNHVRLVAQHKPGMGKPSAATAAEREEYHELLRQVDKRWKKRLPPAQKD